MRNPSATLLKLVAVLISVVACAKTPAIAPTLPVPLPSQTPYNTPPPGLTASLSAPSTIPPQLPAERSQTATATSTKLTATLGLEPADWKNWPVLPIVPERALQVYQLGRSLGNDPHAFSILGDCQSVPEVFMGVYESDPTTLTLLPSDLQETVKWFWGSFNRQSPTVRTGTTTGALLWALWHQNKFTCGSSETPLHCELRIHKPSFVIIQVGTHAESHNENYMRLILDQLLAAGVVPILSTKADDYEGDEHVNAQYAQLAVEYNLPFWNFWLAVNSLPDRGLYSKPQDTYQGGYWLTDDAVAIHRLTALQALDLVRRSVGDK